MPTTDQEPPYRRGSVLDNSTLLSTNTMLAPEDLRTDPDWLKRLPDPQKVDAATQTVVHMFMKANKNESYLCQINHDVDTHGSSFTIIRIPVYLNNRIVRFIDFKLSPPGHPEPTAMTELFDLGGSTLGIEMSLEDTEGGHKLIREYIYENPNSSNTLILPLDIFRESLLRFEYDQEHEGETSEGIFWLHSKTVHTNWQAPHITELVSHKQLFELTEHGKSPALVEEYIRVDWLDPITPLEAYNKYELIRQMTDSGMGLTLKENTYPSGYIETKIDVFHANESDLDLPPIDFLFSLQSADNSLAYTLNRLRVFSIKLVRSETEVLAGSLEYDDQLVQLILTNILDSPDDPDLRNVPIDQHSRYLIKGVIATTGFTANITFYGVINHNFMLTDHIIHLDDNPWT